MAGIKTYTPDGSTRIFSADCRVVEDKIRLEVDGVFQAPELYDVINDAAVFHVAPEGGVLTVQTYEDAQDLASTSDLATLADLHDEIQIVSDNTSNINTVAANDSDISTVADDIDNVTIVANDIDSVNLVANTITANGETVGTGSGQFLGASTLGAVMYTSQVVNEPLTLISGTNGLIVDSVTFEGNGSITVEDNAVLKVV